MCGTLYRFTDALRTHPSPVIVMRADYQRVSIACAHSGQTHTVTRKFFDRHYEAVQ